MVDGNAVNSMRSLFVDELFVRGSDHIMADPLGSTLATTAGRKKYKLRQQTVEPVFGIIKSVLGFRRFLLRGLESVKLEWALICVAYNLKRLHRMGVGLKLAGAG